MNGLRNAMLHLQESRMHYARLLCYPYQICSGPVKLSVPL